MSHCLPSLTLCPHTPEGKSLKDEDVLQNLPVGTTATLYFRDLGAQISWVTVRDTRPAWGIPPPPTVGIPPHPWKPLHPCVTPRDTPQPRGYLLFQPLPHHGDPLRQIVLSVGCPKDLICPLNSHAPTRCS